MRLNFIKSQNGQSSVETAVMCFILLIFVVLFFSALYLIYASYWAEHITYESLICYQERNQKEFCLNQAIERIHSTLGFNKSFDMKMEVAGSITRSQIQMKMDLPLVAPKIFTFKKELRI